MKQKRVVIVGGGFAGMSCAARLINHPDIHITLIDKNNYHKFTPLLYQIATSAISVEDVVTPFRHYFHGKSNIDIKMVNATSIEPKTHSVQTEEGVSYHGDFLVLAVGSVVNFFNTLGAESNSFPLYTLTDAEKLRSRIIATLEDADRNPKLIEEGALNFVVVGAGATGTEIAGAIADMLRRSLPKEFSDLNMTKANIYLVDYSQEILNAFSKKSQEYATKTLQDRRVHLKLGLSVKEVASDHVLLSNGEKILTRTVIWAGGLQTAPLAGKCGFSTGHGGRINIQPDLTIENYPYIYALGDFANILDTEGKSLPQLASVAKQSGVWAAKNILAQIAGKPRKPFQYNDKGIMAMIGRNAAIAEIGAKRHELHGFLAYLSWLGVHAALLSTLRQKIGAVIGWTIDYFGHSSLTQILDRSDTARINWSKDKKENQ